MRKSWLSLISLLLLSACWTTVRPERTLPPEEKPIAVTTASPAATPVSAPAGPVSPQAVLGKVEGDDSAKLFSLLPTSVGRCKGAAGGVMQLEVRTQNGEVSTVLQSSTAGGEINQCVLNAITFDLDDALADIVDQQQAGAASPSGVLAPLNGVLTVRW